MADKKNQLDPKGKNLIRVSIPISGAAVGMLYFSHLISALHKKTRRFHFNIVSKDAPFTKAFLSEMSGKPWVDLHVGKKDREVVDLYDNLLDKEVVSLEVTKPSEQAFKAILGTQRRGGVILLFAEPVGQQEFDNLDFLERHKLIPSREIQKQLWGIAERGGAMEPALRKQILREAGTWRGVRLPWRSQKSADFIWWMLESGIFSRMLTVNRAVRVKDGRSDILDSHGVDDFWDLAASV